MGENMKTELVSAIYLQDMELQEKPADSQPPNNNKNDETFTVEDAVEKIGFGRFHILLFFIMGSSTILEAMEIMLLAVVSPEIRCEWRLSDWKVALVSTMVFLGFMLCGVLSGYIADRYGRWKVVFGGFVWSAYFSLLTSFAPSYGWFIFLRSMVGCGVAGVSQGFVLKTEFIPAKYRAILLPLASVFWMLGSMLIIVLGMVVVPSMGWRWMIRISVTPSIILIFLFKFIPESARYNVSAGNVQAAVETLQRIAKMNRASLPPGRLVESAVVRHLSVSHLSVSHLSVSSSGPPGGVSRERARQLEDAAQLFLQTDLAAALVHLVRGVLCVLRLGAEQLGAAGEEPPVRDQRRRRASGQAPAGGRAVLLHPLPPQRLPDAARQLPRRSRTGPTKHLSAQRFGTEVESDRAAAGVGHFVHDAQHLHHNVWLHRAAVPAPLSGLHELHRGLYLHRRGVPDGGALVGDGFLYVVQSDRRNDRSVHRSGADVRVSDPGALSVRRGVRYLRSRKLSAADRNSRTSSSANILMENRYCFTIVTFVCKD
ncbi:putative transporter SVOPL isoform X2 [Sander vitreus]